MAEPNSETKKLRDRFLAFAFASADLLLEVNEKKVISFVAGATKKITGTDPEKLQELPWLDLFVENDRAMVSSLQARAKHGKRFGPVLVHLNENYKTNLPAAILTGISLPDYPDHFYMTLSQGSSLSGYLAQQERKSTTDEVLTPEDFAKAALESISSASAMGQDLDITFLELPQTDQLQKKMGDQNWDVFKKQLYGMLKGASVDGQAASEIAEGKFSLLHEKGQEISSLTDRIKDLSKESDPEGMGIEVETQTVEAKQERLSEREFAKALVYTISKFEEKGNDLTLGSINDGFESFLGENAERISHLKSIINQQRFKLAFQPIVNLQTGEAHHYESLVRFQSDKSPFEIITFGEDIGLAPEIDLMICSKALSYVLFNLQDQKDISLAINLSGVSIQSENFIKQLKSKFEPHLKTENIAQRVMFEITESSQIKDLDQVNHFVDILRQDGFQVWLDDFGAGSASFQYLQGLNVDGVKIDGQYIDNITKSDRDRKLTKNLVNLCHDLGMKTVAERVETKQQVELLRDLKVDYGQGYYFSKPHDVPQYKKGK